MNHDFEFDPDKDRANKERHGVGLGWARALWNETHVVIPAKNVAGENRCLILAKVGGRCYAAIYTERRGVIRLISCHKADRRLKRMYENKVKKTH